MQHHQFNEFLQQMGHTRRGAETLTVCVSMETEDARTQLCCKPKLRVNRYETYLQATAAHSVHDGCVMDDFIWYPSIHCSQDQVAVGGGSAGHSSNMKHLGSMKMTFVLRLSIRWDYFQQRMNL